MSWSRCAVSTSAPMRRTSPSYTDCPSGSGEWPTESPQSCPYWSPPHLCALAAGRQRPATLVPCRRRRWKASWRGRALDWNRWQCGRSVSSVRWTRGAQAPRQFNWLLLVGDLYAARWCPPRTGAGSAGAAHCARARGLTRPLPRGQPEPADSPGSPRNFPDGRACNPRGGWASFAPCCLHTYDRSITRGISAARYSLCRKVSR